ncbi:MAG: DUF1592 domain-containing protein [Planctomycetota bacterium]
MFPRRLGCHFRQVMFFITSVVLMIVASWSGVVSGETPPPPAVCSLEDRFFEDEVWAKVGERTCLRCHHPQGDAAESGFLLTRRTYENPAWLQDNCKTFQKMAMTLEGDKSKLLLKVTGGLDHGGGQVLKPDSTGYRILERYIRRLNPPKGASVPPKTIANNNTRPFFEGVVMTSPRRLLRRVTLSLAARLPTASELAAVDQRGQEVMDSILDGILQEQAFYDRLKEGFNDIFLTIGIEDNAETLLSYDHFEKTRLWYDKHDLSHVPEAERQRARWKLADVYRDALLREPLELITHIVRNNRPFSELVTADYIMVSPYTARGYGIFDEVKDQFKDPENPFEYIPARLKALKGRDGKTQESATGMYPHAGFLSTFHYLRRYPSTETNRNRLRARMLYQHFLGIDIMQLAPRVTDAAAVAAKYEIPTMQAADCVVCHKTIDPVAGLFQDYNFEGGVGPRKAGWYTDMFKTGFEGESMPPEERWRAPQWLAQRVVKDPRFPVAMVEHVYYILFGRKVLQLPDDIDDPMFNARRRGYVAQRQLIEQVANRFAKENFNLKVAFKALINSEFYRVDGLAVANADPQRRAELDDVGLTRLLSPEQMERKLNAIFGKRWGRLDDSMKVLYGGIDSITVTERNADPSGAMGAIQRLLANDVACYHVARDFRRDAAERLLFPRIEQTDLPGDDAANLKIKQAIVDLHQRLLGHERAVDHPEIERTFQLFTGVLADVKAQGRFEPRESYFCGGREEFRMEDPHYSVRAWRGVVTYLLRQHEFLYE